MNNIRRNELGQFARATVRRRRVHRRNESGQFAKPPSRRTLIAGWAAVAVSLLLLWFAASMLEASFGAFRSCSDSTGLTLTNCGKQSLNLGDLVLIGLFILAAALTLSLFTHAVRITKRLLP